MTSLTADCLLEVLENLKNENSTLHSCLLVNRLWCQQTIPILWHHPFDYEISKRRCITIIQTYIACLKKQEIQEKFTQLSSFELNKPLFDYPRYLQHLQISNIRKAINRWILFNAFNDKFDILFQLLINLFFNRTKGFRELSVYLDHDSDWLKMPHLLQNNLSLSNLQKFNFIYENKKDVEVCLGTQPSALFELLQKYAKNIRNLKFSITFHNKQRCLQSQLALLISLLIESQQGIEILELNDFWNIKKPSQIFKAIDSQFLSLRYLHVEGLKNFDPLLTILVHCNNLETLNLKNFGQTMLIENFDKVKFSNLNIKHLYSWDIPSYLDADDMGLLLKMINKSLRTLALDRVDDGLIEIIENFCPNIQSLSLAMFNASFPKLLPSLIYNLPLNHLYLDIFGYNFAEILTELTNSIPSSVTSLYINFTLDSEQFNYFLNEMNARPNTLGIIDRFMIQKEYLKIIEIVVEYAKNHDNLKVLHWFGNLDDNIKAIAETIDTMTIICSSECDFLDSQTHL